MTQCVREVSGSSDPGLITVSQYALQLIKCWHSSSLKWGKSPFHWENVLTANFTCLFYGLWYILSASLLATLFMATSHSLFPATTICILLADQSRISQWPLNCWGRNASILYFSTWRFQSSFLHSIGSRSPS